MGYNGANNTGSETRLISIIEDLRTVFGKDVELTIPTLNEKNLRRYLEEDEHLKIVPIPSIYFFALKKIVEKQDLVLLVEGSCYMDTWTSALLWAFLWTTRCAYNQGIPCIAYAVDSGDLSKFNRFLVRREANKTDLIITRTTYAMERLIEIGVTAPIVSTADCAFSFETKLEAKHSLKKIWNSEQHGSNEGFVGMAVVDFHLWPVVIRPWGRKINLYKWPYYFSRSKSRVQSSKTLSKNWAREADRIVELYSKNIILICMEELDEPLAIEIKNRMKHSEKAQIVSAGTYNASQMTEVLRSLELLITSRYHAGVLSMKRSVPQIGVGHDQRLKGLYKDIEIEKELFIDYPKDNSNVERIWKTLSKKVDELMENPQHVKELIGKCYQKQVELSLNNKKYLKKFLFEHKDVMV
ncbi:MAG: polysaccharide pyruvyl transferase family protein [Methanobacterium sp. ERen5]|nr:MAG: polysaccharide pyruvyl transferase family protein [Methanobacterium sp. ERen5]